MITQEEAAAILRVTFPTTENALKSAYRRRSLDIHPDRSIAVDAAAQFARLTNAYEFAKTQPSWFLGGVIASAVCVDGTPLSALGQGLGPTTNGKTCTDCGGKGFSSVREDRAPCTDCRWSIFEGWQYRCTKCKGDGRFKRGGRVVGNCFPCKGAGWIRSQTRSRFFGGSTNENCRSCYGAGSVPNPRAALIHTKCDRCKGAGETIVFNPVIPKGLLR